jgi:hypothetical protein
MRSDADVKRDVEAELHSDPSLDATDIAVAVTDGVVALTALSAHIGSGMRQKPLPSASPALLRL